MRVWTSERKEWQQDGQHGIFLEVLHTFKFCCSFSATHPFPLYSFFSPSISSFISSLPAPHVSSLRWHTNAKVHHECPAVFCIWSLIPSLLYWHSGHWWGRYILWKKFVYFNCIICVLHNNIIGHKLKTDNWEGNFYPQRRKHMTMWIT